MLEELSDRPEQLSHRHDPRIEPKERVQPNRYLLVRRQGSDCLFGNLSVGSVGDATPRPHDLRNRPKGDALAVR